MKKYVFCIPASDDFAIAAAVLFYSLKIEQFFFTKIFFFLLAAMVKMDLIYLMSWKKDFLSEWIH